MGEVTGHLDKRQEHWYSQEEWGAVGILNMSVNHPKCLVVEKGGGVGLVFPLYLPTSPPVVPPRPALLGEEVDAPSQQSVELVETSGDMEVCRRLPFQRVETFFGVAQVPFTH